MHLQVHVCINGVAQQGCGWIVHLEAADEYVEIDSKITGSKKNDIHEDIFFSHLKNRIIDQNYVILARKIQSIP